MKTIDKMWRKAPAFKHGDISHHLSPVKILSVACIRYHCILNEGLRMLA